MPSDVAGYYDSNTRRFLPNQKAMEIGAIHRKLYAEGIRDPISAAQYANELVLREITDISARRILDIGCGVGGSIRYLSSRMPATYDGITISSQQVKEAKQFGTVIEQADYMNQEWFEGRDSYDLLYAIESFQHAPDRKVLASHLAKISRPGSVLVIIDDFLKHERYAEHGLTRRFKKYWHAHGIGTADALSRDLTQYGFVLKNQNDLSEYMSLNSFMRLWIGLFASILRTIRIPGRYVENIIGGHALTQMQAKKLAGYYKMVFVFQKG